MEGKRFDELTTGLAKTKSRRGVLRGVAAGGFASALAVIGIGHDEADAKHRHHRRRHHHHHHHGGNNISIPIGIGTIANGAKCKKSKQCASGNCESGVCVDCPALQICQGGSVCCTISALCVADLCVLG